MANYWLVKTEPECFSFDDLKKCSSQTTYWDGVRNYQARNFLRDQMKTGDEVLFYHSNAEPNLIMGVCEVVKEGYPDFTQFDPENQHYDPKSKTGEPTWYMVDIKLKQEFNRPVTLSEIKSNPKLQNMKLVQKGSRLSVMPVEKDEFAEILKMSDSLQHII